MAVKVGERTYQNVEQWQVEYIVANKDRKLREVGKEIGVNERRVGEILKALGIVRERHWKVYLPKTKEVEEDLRNPYLSHAELGAKYSVTDSCIALRRKELGIGVRRKNYDTLIEKQVAEILDDLDLVYSQQKRIDKWSIDFYLGRKHCIDIHGTWAHSKEIVKDRDVRKESFMKENGYNYLAIHESELGNIESVVGKIKSFTQGFPQQ